MKKKLVITGLILSVLAAGWFGYTHYKNNNTKRSLLSIVPNDAVYILKTNELTDAWEEVSKTNIWHHFIKTKGFEYMQDIDTLLNKTLLDNKATQYIFHNRPTLMSAHMIGNDDYDLLYVVDLQSAKYVKQLFDYLLKLNKSQNISTFSFQKTKIYKLENKEQGGAFYIASIDNLLVSSFSFKLIKQVISEKDQTHWEKHPDFVRLNDKLQGELVQFYFNYKQLARYGGIYFRDASTDLQAIGKQLTLSAMDVSQDDERITMEGFTATDSLPSYMNALLDVKPGKIRAYNVISRQAALYTSLGFKNFNLFYQSLLDQYGNGDKSKKDAYRKQLKKLESFLKIDLQKDLFDWIGQEVAIVKMRSDNKQNPADVVMLIEAQDADDAQKGLMHIVNQIRKRSPFKFKAYKYKNFDINYLHQKRFFKAILGNLFAKIDKPYYTFIENYVVFSNSEKVLKSFIDDYITGKTLSHDKDFMDFKDDLNGKANFQVYIQMPKLYDILQKSLTAKGRKALDEKKDLMLSFSRIGFQMASKGELFETKIVMDHDEKALEQEKAEQIARKIDKSIHNNFFEDLQFKISFPDSLQVADGKYVKYHSDGKTIKVEGKVQDNLPEGIWRTYYASGRLQSVANYDDGEVDGDMYYYFDQSPETKMVEMHYDHDIPDGAYMEYWKNGAQKAKLHYKNGKLHGEAYYYFRSGKIKVKGHYRKGEKKGKWLYYNKKGDVINKKRYSILIF